MFEDEGKEERITRVIILNLNLATVVLGCLGSGRACLSIRYGAATHQSDVVLSFESKKKVLPPAPEGK